jgi:hypothetical protein
MAVFTHPSSRSTGPTGKFTILWPRSGTYEITLARKTGDADGVGSRLGQR